MWINFGVLKSTKTTKTHPIETSQVSKSKSVGFDISSVYKDHYSYPKYPKSSKNKINHKNNICPSKCDSNSKVYINNIQCASDSYSSDMDLIDDRNPLHIRSSETD